MYNADALVFDNMGENEEEEEGGLRAKATAYFKGKFKRQRRRAVQRVIQATTNVEVTGEQLLQ